MGKGGEVKVKDLIRLIEDYREYEVVHRNPYDAVLDGQVTLEEVYDFDIHVNEDEERVELP